MMAGVRKGISREWLRRADARVPASDITVLVSVRDGMPYLPETVASILGQSHGDFHFLVIDDGSVDQTPVYLAGLRDPRVSVLRRERSVGISASLNEGLGEIGSPLIAKIDGDDIAAKDRLAVQRQLFLRQPKLILSGSSVEVFGDRRDFWKFPESDAGLRAYLLFSSPFPHSSVMMRGDVMRRHDLRYNEEISCAIDYDLWVRMSAFGEMSSTGRMLARYRVHARSVSSTRRADQLATADRCRAMALSKILGMEMPDWGIAPARALTLGRFPEGNSRETEEACRAAARWCAALRSCADGRGDLAAALSSELGRRWRSLIRHAPGNLPFPDLCRLVMKCGQSGGLSGLAESGIKRVLGI